MTTASASTTAGATSRSGSPAGPPRDGADAGSGRIRGLDGLRALAVAAVVAYHADPALLPGGFLGVDLFFVLSGYLITRLLLAEVAATGRIRLGAFYARRARRLLPALGVVTTAVCAAALVWRDQLAILRGAVLATAGYATNWWLAESHQSYFVATGRPSMLQHLWSLAIEEQFYLVWPALLVVVVGGRAVSRRGGRSTAPSPLHTGRVAFLATVLAAGSAVAMGVAAMAGDVPYGNDGSRLYYGTDTHATGLLLGAAAGALAAGRLAHRGGAGVAARSWPRGRRAATDVVALLALLALARLTSTTDAYHPELYRGGFTVVAVLAATAVAAVAREGSRLGRVLDAGPLRWLGRRSYGVYLWHWPVLVVTRPGLDVPAPTWLVQVLRVVIVLALAAASYRWVEQPVRRAGLAGLVASVTGARAGARVRLPGRPALSRSATTTLVTLVFVAAGVLVADPSPVGAVARAAGAAGTTPAAVTTPPAAPRAAAPTSPSVSPPASSPVSASPASSPSVSPSAGAPPVAVTAFGDSVLLGARPAVAAVFPDLTVDAVEGRQARDVLADARSWAAAGRVGPLVVLHVGDNGIVPTDDLRQTLAALSRVRRVLVLTVRVDRPWEKPANDTIETVTPTFANARLVDWHSASAAHPEWFYEDGLHLRQDGAQAYAALLAAAAS